MQCAIGLNRQHLRILVDICLLWKFELTSYAYHVEKIKSLAFSREM